MNNNRLPALFFQNFEQETANQVSLALRFLLQVHTHQAQANY